MDAQGRGLCISFSWLVNERTLIGTPSHCAGSREQSEQCFSHRTTSGMLCSVHSTAAA